MPGPRVEVLGIRHHGPGSARSVAAALDELAPAVVVIEGPPELDGLVRLGGSPDLCPPVAGLVYAVGEPRRASFYPLATFSPEWVALRWAAGRGVPVRFADLPATHALAPPAEDTSETVPDRAVPNDTGPDETGPDDTVPNDTVPDETVPDETVPDETVPGQGTPAPRADPIGQLARAAGYDDPERWWEDAVEHRHASALSRFTAIREAMSLVRAGDAIDDETLRREAAMRRVLRGILRELSGDPTGEASVAVVCGAYHAPALTPDAFPSAGSDSRLLSSLPRTKVNATWVPWTSARLSYDSGYGAGVSAPGWYHHLFTTWERDPGDVVAGWLVKVARTLRQEGIDAPPASLVEAARMAEGLAAVRGRPTVGLAELTDAAQTVLCDGSSLPLTLVERHLVVGDQLGRVPRDTPMVPLAASLQAEQRRLRLKPSAVAQSIVIDLRKESQLARSVLLHRLRLLGLPWGTPADVGRTGGTFKEAWELVWQPEFAVTLIEASVYGTTVAGAAEAVVVERAGAAADLSELGVLLEQCLLTELPGALNHVVAELAERTALHHDALALLESVEPLARACRYGTVRGIDVEAVAEVLRTAVARICVGLRAACGTLDDDAAARMRAAIDGTHRGITLLEDRSLLAPWYAALGELGRPGEIHGSVSGRVNRILLDAGELEPADAVARLSRRLSPAAPAPAAAAWLDGFLTGELLVLLHDRELLGVIDRWVGEVAEHTFEDLLPLLRRTFSRYSPAERRQLGTHLSRTGGVDSAADRGYDLALARPTLVATAELLGLEVLA